MSDERPTESHPSLPAARVFFAPPTDIAAAVPRLIRASGFLERLNSRRRVGVKVHFGEDGNHAHLNPAFVRAAAETLGCKAADCALLETSTLYRGRRATAHTHIALAHDHGFSPTATMLPIDIIDGKQGEDHYAVPVNLKLVKEAFLGRRLKFVPSLLNMAHFKGHFVTGFGGVFKNLAMGLAAKRGKLEMHCLAKPTVNSQVCKSCGECIDYCPNDAIDFVRKVARIGRSCTGCAGCLTVCRYGAIDIDWGIGGENLMQKVVEYSWAVLQGRVALHMNFVINVTPSCDCMGMSEKPLMPDVGVFASLDPVACEQAAYDRAGSVLEKHYPNLTPIRQIEYAEEIGLGSRRYELVPLDS